MNMIIRVLTISLMVSMLVLGMANYARMGNRGVFLAGAAEDLQESLMPVLQYLHPFAALPDYESVAYYGTDAPVPPVAYPEIRP